MFKPPIPIEQRELFRKWLGGVVLAVILAVSGVSILWEGHATIRARRGDFKRSSIQLDGFDPRLFGAVLVLGAAALHSGLFWRTHNRFWRYGEIGLAISGIGCAVLGFWLLARQLMNLV